MTKRAGRVAAWASLALASMLCLQANAQANAGRAPTRASASHRAAPPTPADLRVQQAVLHKLETDGHLLASGIEVAAKKGIVELRGTVSVLPWRERASRVARVVRGVRGVVNRIRVVPVQRPDSVVAKDVRAALRATAALAMLPIAVHVTDGVVELTGAISTWEEQQLAERVATSVPGVRFCQNQLTSRGGTRRTPAVIAADIRSRLAWDPLVQQAPIRVSVRGARVVLSGTTGSPAERRRVIAHAWLKGVSAVDAKALVVDTTHRPDQNVRLSAPTDQEISAAIHDLAPYWPPMPTSNWTASVAAGVVTLRGTVPTLVEKRALEQIVRSAVGVVDVRSELRGPWWQPPTQPPRSPRPTRKRVPRRR